MFSQKQLKKFSKLASQKINDSKIFINYFKEPYKHLIIDNFLEKELADQCLKNFPDIKDSNWEFSNDANNAGFPKKKKKHGGHFINMKKGPLAT